MTEKQTVENTALVKNTRVHAVYGNVTHFTDKNVVYNVMSNWQQYHIKTSDATKAAFQPSSK